MPEQATTARVAAPAIHLRFMVSSSVVDDVCPSEGQGGCQRQVRDFALEERPGSGASGTRQAYRADSYSR